MQRLRTVIFGLYEQPRIRNWFYTIAFAIFVPTGFRFARLAWEFGDWFDRPLAVIAGAFIGLIAIVTLVRFWQVAPRKTIPTKPTEEPHLSAANPPSDVLAAVKWQAGRNRQYARDAASLGSTFGRR
jgi:hypothetical protein